METQEEKRPILLVAALMIDSDGTVLLSRHAPYWKWHLPDGDVRFGESLADALARSFKEDFAVAPEVISDGVWFVTETIRPQKGIHFVTHHFRAVAPPCASLAPRLGIEHFYVNISAAHLGSAYLESTALALQEARRQKLL